MSNHLAIATVTATLQRILQASVQRDVEGARVSTVAPNRIGQGTPETGINLFLYHVVRNNALKNPDAMALRSRNKQTALRQTALELYYMLSFYGNETELEPQRLLGSVIRTFNDRTSLTSALIKDTIADSTLTFLRDSNLASQVQDMQIVPVDMNLEDLSKVWSVFFQTPYLLSIPYKVMAIVIDGEDQAQRALPVRDRPHMGPVPFMSRPQVDRVIAQAGQFQPILPDSVLLIQGNQLQGLSPQVRVGDRNVTPTETTPSQITLPLTRVPPDALRAGVQSLQVIHTLSAANPATANTMPTRQVASNLAPFVLCPVIKTIEVRDLEEEDETTCSATLTLEASPIVRANQRVLLSLYEWSVDSPAIYLLDAPELSEDTTSLSIPVQRIKRGNYLVRLVVDGAESQLGVDTDPDSVTYNWYTSPRISL
jgi:hypothetical protein